MKGYYPQVVELLKRHGYIFLRNGKGSHQIWTNGVRNQTVSSNLYSRDMANTVLK